MKIVRIIFLAFCVLYACESYSQRLISGTKGIELNVGKALGYKTSGNIPFLDNCTVDVSGFYIHGSENYIEYGASYLSIVKPYSDVYIPVRDLSVKLGYMFKLFSDNQRNFIVYAGATALGGYEFVNDDKTELYDGSKLLSKSNYIYGFTPQASMEMFLNDKISLIASFKVSCVFHSDFEVIRPNISIGTRFSIW